jgi:hypothetical protein
MNKKKHQKKYSPPKIIVKKLSLNLFFRNQAPDFEGVLLAGCSCINGYKLGRCANCAI